jgi:GAF domain-containing protein
MNLVRRQACGSERSEIEMDSFQQIVESLLFATDASRALFQLSHGDDRFPIRAEAVRRGFQQIRHGKVPSDTVDREALERGKAMLVENEAEIPGLSGVKARMVAPLLDESGLKGWISVHADAPRSWTSEARLALETARAEASALLAANSKRRLRMNGEELRVTAVQTILDELRQALDVQRCTFRRPVLSAYAFPVAFESRAEGINSLLGDFTIIQTGQPVINLLLSKRAQVVQEDCSTASSEPHFHNMLAHYGGMRAQIVTPFIVGDELKGVLSIHELRHPRDWTEEEKKFGAAAAHMIGTLFEQDLG